MNMDHHVVKKLSQNQHLGPRQRRETAKADDQCLALPKLHPAHSHVQDHVQAFFAFLSANHFMKLHFAIRVTVPYRSHIKLFDQHITAESVEHSTWHDVTAFALSLLPTWAARFANLQPNIFTAIFSQKMATQKFQNRIILTPCQVNTIMSGSIWVNCRQATIRKINAPGDNDDAAVTVRPLHSLRRCHGCQGKDLHQQVCKHVQLKKRIV